MLNLLIMNTGIRVLLLAGFTISSLASWYLRRYRRPVNKASSSLLSFYTQGAQLVKMRDNILSDGTGHITFGVVAQGTKFDQHEVMINILYLPFTTNIRLLAISRNSSVKINPSLGRSPMKPVALEGDFPNYFNLYANDGQGFDVRYFLDPATMAFVADFCLNHDWELINNELIIVSREEYISDKVIERFIAELRPSVEVPADQGVHPTYRPAHLRKLNCPICGLQTKNTGDTKYSCPDGHGHLITAKEMRVLAKLPLRAITVADNRTQHTIECPNCSQPMVKITYRRNTIDSCINCPFRWLDTHELIP